MERADHRGRVDVWDVALHLAESLYELVQGFSFLLGEQMKIAFLAMGFVAACEGANKLMAKSAHEEMESSGKCMSQDLTLGLSTSGK